MNRYTYPAVFSKEKDGGYSVVFPDLEGCYTCGDDLADALYMAQDVLAFTLYDYEKYNRPIPEPSVPDDLAVGDGEFVNYVACDTLYYRNQFLPDPAGRIKREAEQSSFRTLATIDRYAVISNHDIL